MHVQWVCFGEYQGNALRSHICWSQLRYWWSQPRYSSASAQLIMMQLPQLMQLWQLQLQLRCCYSCPERHKGTLLAKIDSMCA
jgi:hypothetical protein